MDAVVARDMAFLDLVRRRRPLALICHYVGAAVLASRIRLLIWLMMDGSGAYGGGKGTVKGTGEVFGGEVTNRNNVGTLGSAGGTTLGSAGSTTLGSGEVGAIARAVGGTIDGGGRVEFSCGRSLWKVLANVMR